MYSHAELEAIESASKNKNLYGDLKYCPEMITNIDELAKYGNSEIKIIKELHREKAVEVLKMRGETE